MFGEKRIKMLKNCLCYDVWFNVGVPTCMCVHACTCVWVCIHMCVCMCMCMCMCAVYYNTDIMASTMIKLNACNA